MRPTKTLGMMLILTLTFWGGMKCQSQLNTLADIGKPHFESEMLYFDKLDTSIYIKSRTWGLLGNHSRTVISLDKTKEFFPDSLADYIFYGSEIFYRQTSDSLIIYYNAMKSSPDQFNTNVGLRFIKINGPTYHKLEERVKTGLRKFE